MAKLRGDELLEFVRTSTANGTDRDSMIQDAGYCIHRDGRPNIQRTEFFQALSAAQGIDIGPTISRSTNKGKPATYRLRVSPKGLVPVGPSYTKLIGAVPGDYIKVIHEEDGLWLEREPAEEPVNCPIGTVG